MSKIFWLILIAFLCLRLAENLVKSVSQEYLRKNIRITSEPTYYQNSQRISFGKHFAYVDRYPELNYGDQVIIEGTITGREVKDAKILGKTASGGLIYTFRKKLVALYDLSLPRPHSSLVAGVTIGSKALINQNFWEQLKQSGTAHVVVASGMNVTLVAAFIFSAFTHYFPKKRSITASIAGIWVYVLISGMDAPIVRAGIMGSLAFTAKYLGRVGDAKRILIISAILMLIAKPEWLLDVGFQLSFVATYSLILFESFVSTKLMYVPKIIRSDLSTSIAAQIGVAPLLFLYFGQFNIFAPFINAIILWTIPLITILGFIGGLLVLIYFPIGKAFLLLTYPLTSWFLFIVKIFS